MLVLGALLILTTLVVDFAYNSHVGFDLAASERDRLKAYYLARSGYQLARLELRFEKDMRARYASLLKEMKDGAVTADPLCKQIPISTGLLRDLPSFLSQASGEGTEEGEEAVPKPAVPVSAAPAQPEGNTEPISSDAADFLSFEGGFDVVCDTEERKINLNVFRSDPFGKAPAGTVDSGTSSAEVPVSLYDTQKILLTSLLSQKEFEDIFHEKSDDIRKVVNAIADWADRDDRINEAPGISGGSEDSEYRGASYKVKNGKYASVAELLLVAGVGDDLFRKLEPYVTVYGDAKINLCQATDDMVKAFALRFIAATPGVPPISEDDEAKWNFILESLRTACAEAAPQPAAVAQAFAAAIGAATPGSLASQITTKNRFYRIESNGNSGDATSRISAVIDTGGSDPNLWKTVYFRVE